MILCACAGWSESAHFAHARRHFFAWCGPCYNFSRQQFEIVFYFPLKYGLTFIANCHLKLLSRHACFHFCNTFNSFGAKFQTTFVVCFFLTNYRLERSLYVKLKDWMSNSVDPDETDHYEPSHLDLCCLQKSIFSPMAEKELRGLAMFGRLFSIFWKRDTILAFLFLSLTPSAFWKWVYTKRKPFAPNGSKCFPFRMDIFNSKEIPVGSKVYPYRVELFSEGRQNHWDRVVCPESVLIPIKMFSDYTRRQYIRYAVVHRQVSLPILAVRRVGGRIYRWPPAIG